MCNTTARDMKTVWIQLTCKPLILDTKPEKSWDFHTTYQCRPLQYQNIPEESGGYVSQHNPGTMLSSLTVMEAPAQIHPGSTVSINAPGGHAGI